MSVESTPSEDASIFVRTDTISSGATEPGLGYLSGRAIKRLGEVVLNGVDDILINREINRIESYFRKNSLPVRQDAVGRVGKMYHTLLELTNPGFKSSFHTRSMKILMGHIGAAKLELLAETVVNIASHSTTYRHLSDAVECCWKEGGKFSEGEASTIYTAGYQSYAFHLVPGVPSSGPIIVYLALVALLGTREHVCMITNLVSQNRLGASKSEEDTASAQLLGLLAAKTNNGTCTGTASDFLTWCRLLEISRCLPPSQISWMLSYLLQRMGHTDENVAAKLTSTLPRISHLASLVSSENLLLDDEELLAEVMDLMSDPRENAGFLGNLQRRVEPADLVLQDGYLIGGTLEALLEYLTSPSIAYARPYFRAFSLTFKTFTTVEEFLDEIANRLQGKPPPDLPREQEGQWKEIVQLRSAHFQLVDWTVSSVQGASNREATAEYLIGVANVSDVCSVRVYWIFEVHDGVGYRNA
ncbi:hypothetical protein V5O48_013963 [Marasmius crinis-equi]|uniref:N-terminal Ras-GEF domain-containing protein n=1 Tax=Marasmius crinis-equi TaxID=585013 RepID=A0ABR3EYM4_9AGAR